MCRMLLVIIRTYVCSQLGHCIFECSYVHAYIGFLQYSYVSVPHRCDDDEDCCESDEGEAKCCTDLGVAG